MIQVVACSSFLAIPSPFQHFVVVAVAEHSVVYVDGHAIHSYSSCLHSPVGSYKSKEWELELPDLPVRPLAQQLGTHNLMESVHSFASLVTNSSVPAPEELQMMVVDADVVEQGSTPLASAASYVATWSFLLPLDDVSMAMLDYYHHMDYPSCFECYYRDSSAYSYLCWHWMYWSHRMDS